MTEPLAEHFAGQMGQLLGPDFPSTIALAVSGGGDSMAMLALAHGWARVFGVSLRVVTIDHGLRAEAAAEAAMVADECTVLGLPHTTLSWHWDGHGNLQDAARRARLQLIEKWRDDVDHVLFAHTQDDVAETFLMRLARGSGVEGLSAMAAERFVPPASDHASMGFFVIRPLLNVSRADLRHYIKTLHVPYVDDPSNDDLRYERSRARVALATLGIDANTLAATAQRMARAADALRLRAADMAETCVREDRWNDKPTGDLLVDRDAFARIERDTQLRILAGALQWVASAAYRPRADALARLLDRALSGGGGTLHGTQLIVTPTQLRICREYAAVKDLIVPLAERTVWDNRWQVTTSGYKGSYLRALGPDGWKQVAEKPGGCTPYDAAIALPAVFDGARLVAWNIITPDFIYNTELESPTGSFITSLVSR